MAFTFDPKAFYLLDRQFFVIHEPTKKAIAYFMTIEEARNDAKERMRRATTMGLSCTYIVDRKAVGSPSN